MLKPAFYVSPLGNDANSGTFDSPFATLGRAQTAMRGGAFKTTFLLGGTYPVSAPLTLSLADARQTWMAYPQQEPILDGAGVTEAAIRIVGTNTIMIVGLGITNFTKFGVYADNSPDVSIAGNNISNITSSGWSQAAIYFQRSCRNAIIRGNMIHNTQYAGIWVGANTNENISNLLIEGNFVLDTVRSINDGGAIYMMDRQHDSTNIVVRNNVIGNRGPATSNSAGIYLDDGLSNAVVYNNTVYGTSIYALILHGGDHNLIQNNIFDISQNVYLGHYQTRTPNFGMIGNAFKCNIVYSANNAPKLWLNDAVGLPPMDVSGNAYSTFLSAKASGAPFPDASPTIVDPAFADVASHDYTLNSPPMPCFNLF
jgi:Right handed beta helix region